jgi:hypothetical protein
MADEPKTLGPKLIQQITIPNHYFNGFEVSNSLSDMGILLLLDGQPQARLSLSFTTAKTLAETLSAAIKGFERATSHNIMTMDDGQDKK